jgi:hypothetical protein
MMCLLRLGEAWAREWSSFISPWRLGRTKFTKMKPRADHRTFGTVSAHIQRGINIKDRYAMLYMSSSDTNMVVEKAPSVQNGAHIHPVSCTIVLPRGRCVILF